MNFTSKTLGLVALGSLLAGFLLGFVPELSPRHELKTR
jgi:hypothetical protein